MNQPSTESIRIASITADQLSARRAAIEKQLEDLLTQETEARESAHQGHYAKARAHLTARNIPAAIHQLRLAANYLHGN